MATPRRCPHCQVFIPPDHGYHFDDKLNLICEQCGKVAFPATAEGSTSFRQAGDGYPAAPGVAPPDNRQNLSKYGQDEEVVP